MPRRLLSAILLFLTLLENQIEKGSWSGFVGRICHVTSRKKIIKSYTARSSPPHLPTTDSSLSSSALSRPQVLCSEIMNGPGAKAVVDKGNVFCTYCPEGGPETRKPFTYKGLKFHTEAVHFQGERVFLKGCRKCLNYYKAGRDFDGHFKNCS